MASFPNRPSLDAFGAVPYQNRRPVKHPGREMGADLGSLMAWQIAGCGIASPKCWGVAEWSGSVMTLLGAGEAWDPKGLYVPTLARTGAGVYTVTYAAAYPDLDGADAAPDLKMVQPSVQTVVVTDVARGTISPGGLVVNIRTFAVGVAADLRFAWTAF